MTRSEVRAIAIAAWFVFGVLAYGGQLAHSRIDSNADQLCRSVNSTATCDDRLLVNRSFFFVWGVAGGPIAFVLTAATTGFFYAGFEFR